MSPIINVCFTDTIRRFTNEFCRKMIEDRVFRISMVILGSFSAFSLLITIAFWKSRKIEVVTKKQSTKIESLKSSPFSTRKLKSTEKKKNTPTKKSHHTSEAETSKKKNNSVSKPQSHHISKKTEEYSSIKMSKIEKIIYQLDKLGHLEEAEDAKRMYVERELLDPNSSIYEAEMKVIELCQRNKKSEAEQFVATYGSTRFGTIKRKHLQNIFDQEKNQKPLKMITDEVDDTLEFERELTNPNSSVCKTAKKVRTFYAQGKPEAAKKIVTGYTSVRNKNFKKQHIHQVFEEEQKKLDFVKLIQQYENAGIQLVNTVRSLNGKLEELKNIAEQRGLLDSQHNRGLFDDYFNQCKTLLANFGTFLEQFFDDAEKAESYFDHDGFMNQLQTVKAFSKQVDRLEQQLNDESDSEEDEYSDDSQIESAPPPRASTPKNSSYSDEE